MLRPRAIPPGILIQWTRVMVIEPPATFKCGRDDDRPRLKTSIAICADDLTAIAGAEGPPGEPADTVLDESDAAVGHQDIRTAGVVAGNVVAEGAIDPATGAVEPTAAAA